MEEQIRLFSEFLANEKGRSPNTITSYTRDLKIFAEFLTATNTNFQVANRFTLQNFITELNNQGKSVATINRMISTLKNFYHFLQGQGVLISNPMEKIQKLKATIERPEFLSVEEIGQVLSNMPTDTAIALRDKAMMELLYATGIKISECIDLTAQNVNFTMKMLTTNGNFGKQRVLPLSDVAVSWLEKYMTSARKELLVNETDVLFLNHLGNPLTRQGIWKNMKRLFDAKETNQVLTPKTLRHSFAKHLIDNGAPLQMVQELLGHQHIQTTRIYLDERQNRMADTYEKYFPRKAEE